MTLFYFGCAILLALAALFVLRPGRRGRIREESSANLDWYALRLRELEGEGNAELVEDARVRLLEEGVAQADSAADRAGMADSGRGRRLPPLVLWLPVALVAGALYWQMGAMRDVAISEQLNTLDAEASREQVESVMAAIASRLEARPDNQGYLALLGRYQMTREDFAAAEATYRSLAERAPGDSRAAAMAAQASYLSAGRRLSPDAQRLAERALAIDPGQRTALGLLGMAAFEQAQYRAAINYWQRLRDAEAPGSPGAEMLDDVIATARARLGETTGESVAGEPGGNAESAGGVAASTGAAILVRVERPGAGELSDEDTVFVLARGVDATTRMPIAVQRLSARDLPTTVRLDDSTSMAGQSLSSAGEVRVFVQVSPDGRPGAENASFAGVSEPVTAAAGGARVSVQLQATGG
jgi:cytochrome c-type biogenesis protein CcmH